MTTFQSSVGCLKVQALDLSFSSYTLMILPTLRITSRLFSSQTILIFFFRQKDLISLATLLIKSFLTSVSGLMETSLLSTTTNGLLIYLLYLFPQFLSLQTGKTKERNDTRGTHSKGTRRVQHGAFISFNTIGEEQHSSSDQLSQQQKATRQGKSFRQTLQHGS